MLQKNNCKFIVMPCNTAHYWYDDLKKKINQRTKAIIFVHISGRPGNLREIIFLAKSMR